MRIKIDLSRQLQEGDSGVPQILDLPEGSTVSDALSKLAYETKSDFQPLLFDLKGNLKPTVLVCVNDQQIHNKQQPLQNGDLISLLMPISGG